MLPSPPDPLQVSRLRQLLQAADVRPRRRLGQNFLVDRHVRDHIVKALGAQADDLILEVGPGAGALTVVLQHDGAFLLALEKDRRLAQLLEQKVLVSPTVKVVNVDALTVPWGKTLLAAAEERGLEHRRLLFVSNLPYSITGPSLFKLMAEEPLFHRAVVMVQREVGDRLLARPATKQYGSLTVLAEFYGRVEPILRVSPGSFWPRPAVASSVISFERHQSPPVPVDEADFLAVVRVAFGQRRKMLRNALAAGLPLGRGEIQDGLLRADIDGSRRGETLTMAEFARLARNLPGAGVQD